MKYHSISPAVTDSLVGFPMSVAFLDDQMTPNESDELVKRYRIGMPHKDWARTIFWQSTPDGKFVDADVVTIARNGTMQEPVKRFSECLRPYAQDLYDFQDCGFFGGELAASGDIVCIVQEPMECLFRAHRNDNYVWLAVGYGRNLTAEKLDLLLGKKVILLSDDEAFPYWEELAKNFKGFAQIINKNKI